MFWGLIILGLVSRTLSAGVLVTGAQTMPSELEIILQHVQKLDPEFASNMRKDPTEVNRLPSDFFRNGRVYQIVSRGRYGPRLMTLGVAEPDFAVSLSANPDGFFDLAKRAGVVLDTPDRRERYARVFLETTKDLTQRTQ